MKINENVKVLGNVKLSDTSRYLLETSRDYALYVNDDRAIPYIGDGLKHVQRVALWLLRSKSEKIKVVGLVGQLAADGLYVHGDVSCADAISLLAAPYRNNVMLVQGDGQFGSRVDPVEGIGAPRYVSVKRSKPAQDFLYTDTDIVPMEDNYDGSNQQPVHFLPLIPTVLLNGVSGIGVGYSTEILPRKFADVVAATIAVLKGKKADTLVPHYERYGVSVKPTGLPNQWSITGKVEIVNTSTVHITELPPGMSLEKFRKRLIEMEDEDQFVKFVDRSTDCISIEVTFKRGSIANWTPATAVQFFKLTEKTTERIVTRDWSGKLIVQYPDAETLVQDFVNWRLEWFVPRYEKMLADANVELMFWRLMEVLFKAGFTKKLGTFANKAAMLLEVLTIAKKAKLTVTDAVAERAVAMATYRWTKEFEAEIADKIASLLASIQEYTAIIADPNLRKEIFLKELDQVKKNKY